MTLANTALIPAMSAKTNTLVKIVVSTTSLTMESVKVVRHVVSIALMATPAFNVILPFSLTQLKLARYVKLDVGNVSMN